MAIAGCTQNIETQRSYYEDDYLQTIEYYKDSDLRLEFLGLFTQLVVEIRKRTLAYEGIDVLGKFFE